MMQLNTKMQIVLDTLSTLDSSPNHFPGQTEPTSLPNFPFSGVADLIELDAQLSAKPDTRKAFESVLTSIGGNSSEDAIRRILKRLLSDNICKLFTWHGTSTKQSFSKLTLNKSILGALVKNPKTRPGATEKLIEETVRSWFKHANDRENVKSKRHPSASFNPEIGTASREENQEEF